MSGFSGFDPYPGNRESEGMCSAEAGAISLWGMVLACGADADSVGAGVVVCEAVAFTMTGPAGLGFGIDSSWLVLCGCGA